MPLWESNEIYFLAGFSVLVTLGVFASLAYFVYRRTTERGTRAEDEQAALEKVLLRKEMITSGPPTKPLIVSPSFSSPNKVPARHLRSGSYSPTHYLSPYHSRQPRRNSSPTSTVSSIQQPRIPQLQLQPPVENSEVVETPNDDGTPGSAPGNCENADKCVPLIKTNNDQQPVSRNHNSQYYGTISPRRGKSVVAPAENVCPGKNTGFLAGSGAVIVPKHNNSFIKSEYAQLPGKDGGDFESDWQHKEDRTWKNCSDVDESALRRKLLLQKQYQQKIHQLRGGEPPGELFKMKHTVSEEIPYYISSQ